jgi:hypothetical protein
MSSNNASGIVSKVWAFCNTLRDDGVGYGDYLEQLTYLLSSRWPMSIASHHIAVRCRFQEVCMADPDQQKWK